MRHVSHADTGSVRVLAVLVLAFVGFWGWQEYRLRANEGRLAEVASQVAGRPVGISCPGFLTRLVEITPNSGWVDFDADGRPAAKASLNAETCRRLEGFHGGQIDALTAQALTTLAHESFHLAGVVGEAQTQCYAVQTVEFVARSLGATPGQARATAQWVAVVSPKLHPGEYWNAPNCIDGGVWDLRPGSAVWP